MRRKEIWSFGLMLALLFLVACVASALMPTATPAAAQGATARHLRVFTRLWENVHDAYVYPDFNGLDWNAVYRRYRARIELGTKDEEFHQAMQEMIDELGDDHSVFFSPQQVAEQKRLLSGQRNYAGIGIMKRTLPDKGYAVLLSVLPDSPAERAGLRRHDRILAVDDVPLVNEHGEARSSLLRGPAGTEVQLTIQTPGREQRELIVTRGYIEAQFQVEAHRLPGTNVGYLLIPTFWNWSASSRVRQAMEGLMADGELDGLIVDMRINGGGLIPMLKDTLSIFTEGELGAFVSRNTERPLLVDSRPVGNSLEVPLIILVGRETESSGEIFSGVLRENGRARLVGRTTEGNVETVWKMDFEDGSRAWLAREIFIPPSGADWEETGIVPDLEISLDWDEFTAETDQQLQAALDWLLKIKMEKKRSVRR
jgi:carboxyl-terminal processing protease